MNASLKDDDDIQRQVKSLYCAANKLRGTFDQCTPAVKNTLFRAYCMPMYACQLWSKHMQTTMKRLRAAYNNAYRIMHYIPRNVSVRPHQVSHCVTTFHAADRMVSASVIGLPLGTKEPQGLVQILERSRCSYAWISCQRN